MPEIQLSDEFLEGYTKAKEEDKQEINKAYDKLHEFEREYAMLIQKSNKDNAYIQENEEYVELGQALKKILDYLRSSK